MCGCYSLTTPRDTLRKVLAPWLTKSSSSTWLNHYAPRAEIHPGEPVLALREHQRHADVTHFLWGFLASWVKDPWRGPRPINARAETIAEKPSFRAAWRHHRCLLPSDGFHEKGQRIHRCNGEPFWLAGLWDHWIGPDGSEVETCCVITTRANALVRPLHTRMPVIVPNGLEEAWLEEGDATHLHALESLLNPWDPHDWCVSRAPQMASRSNPNQLQLF